MAQGRRDRCAGADHGRAPCRASVADRHRQKPRNASRRLDLRQSRPVRPEGRFQALSARRGRRPREARASRGRSRLYPPHGRDVSAGLRHQSDPAEPDRGSVRRGAAQSFRRRGHGGDQAAPAMRARRRGVRREGLPAAPGHQAAGPRSQYPGANRRRADRARGGWARALIAQWVPLPPSGRLHRSSTRS